MRADAEFAIAIWGKSLCSTGFALTQKLHEPKTAKFHQSQQPTSTRHKVATVLRASAWATIPAMPITDCLLPFYFFVEPR
ncbi:MAG: hypothetical protein V7K25_30475 [Nostoc sp.]|uniref:hypothetical protein n=1 Tax=Nostoc sp. TaxID=1180 RepID=UPI002FFA378A